MINLIKNDVPMNSIEAHAIAASGCLSCGCVCSCLPIILPSATEASKSYAQENGQPNIYIAID